MTYAYQNRTTGEIIKRTESKDYVLSECGLTHSTIIPNAELHEEAIRAMVDWYFSDGEWKELDQEQYDDLIGLPEIEDI